MPMVTSGSRRWRAHEVTDLEGSRSAGFEPPAPCMKIVAQLAEILVAARVRGHVA